DPLAALKTYLANREDLQDIQSDLLQAAQSLLDTSEEAWLDEQVATANRSESEISAQELKRVADGETQLRLL
ncbi:MAG TPA: DNA double-strand break repair protein Mre11, partial [Allocoleopsis sp.]